MGVNTRLAVGLLATLLATTACGKSDTASSADKDKKPATAAKTADPKADPKPAEPVAPPKPVATKLAKLPIQADVAPGWKIEEEKVNPGGGARLSTVTGEVSVLVDGSGGLKKMTLEDEKKLADSMSDKPTDAKEDKLADGWAYVYKAGSLLPFHATVYRNLGDASYRCVVTTEKADQRDEGVAICKSLRL